MTVITEIFSNASYVWPLIALIAFTLTYLLIPRIAHIVNLHGLVDQPNHRSAHTASTPTMGGIAFYLVLVLIVFAAAHWESEDIALHFIAALSVIFFIGLRDDLVSTTPRLKLLGELLACSFILFCSCMEVYSLDGFLGVNGIYPIISYLFIYLLLLTIINAFNLIDGIDGLSAVVGIIIFGFFAWFFYQTSWDFYFLLNIALIAMLLAFLRFNISSKQKIFMGDTGSLIIGFCIGLMTLKFLTIEPVAMEAAFSIKAENKLVVIAAVLIIPLLDTVRAMYIRLKEGRSPFSADRNHIHHVLVNTGLSHIQASILLGMINVLVAGLIIFLSTLLDSFQLMVSYALVFVILMGTFKKIKNQLSPEKKKRPIVRAFK